MVRAAPVKRLLQRRGDRQFVEVDEKTWDGIMNPKVPQGPLSEKTKVVTPEYHQDYIIAYCDGTFEVNMIGCTVDELRQAQDALVCMIGEK